MTAMFRGPAQSGMNFQGLIIDNFAGGGGASTGIEDAIGAPVDIAINHDLAAVRMHEVNHPHTRHYCESVWRVDPRVVTGGLPVDLAWFSPDCTHFSKARGRVPVKKEIRGLAWVAVRYAATVKPRVIMLENVEEFTGWGRLVEIDGMLFPSPTHRGENFRSFLNAFKRLGYQVEYRELSGDAYGNGTSRKRLFIIARCDGMPIVWPEPTHGPGQLPVISAAKSINFSLPCPSIFLNKEQGRAAGVRRPLAEKTMQRIAAGVMRYVVNHPDPFIVPGGAVAPFITEHANATHQRNFSVEDPLRTICAEVKGGHFALVSAFLAKHYTGVVGADLRQSMPTITGIDHNALVTSNLIKLRNGCDGQSVKDPLHTLTSKEHFGEVRAFLMKFYSSGGQWQDLRDPMHTIPANDRLGLVMVRGEPYAIADIGMRMLSPRELYRAQGFPENYVISHDINGKPFTKTEQVARVGNSVCPGVVAALVRANLPWRVPPTKQRRAA